MLGRDDVYPTPDGGMISGRPDDREKVYMFVVRAVEANRCLRLFSAATERGGPNVEKLRDLGIKPGTDQRMKERAMAQVIDTIDIHLRNETFTRLYRSRDDGKLFRGPGFHSLLGAMWLQMAALATAPEEDIRRCRWCGEPITFKAGEPPSELRRRARGKYRTRKDRVYCKQKNGVKDYCKTQYNDNRRKAGR